MGTWVLIGGGVPATLDIDFVNDRSTNGVISSLLSCTRATPAAAYYTKADGTLTTFAANTLRYSTNGLLVEEARTNLYQRSQTFDNAYWTKAFGSASADAVAAPDGTTTADAFIPDNGTNTSYVGKAGVAVSNATAYTVSVYAKDGGSATNWLEVALISSSTWIVWFNLATGAKGTSSGSPTSYNITALANGWYRVDITVTMDDTHVDLYLAVRSADGSTADTVGDGATAAFYLWGAQLEAGAFATSYIPTTTASVTRAKDAVTFSSIPSVITAIATAAGTIYLEYPSTGLSICYQFDWADGGNRPLAYKSGASSNTFFDGTNNPGGVTEASVGTINKLTRAWSGSTMSQVINGAANVADSWDGDWNIATPSIGSGNGGNYQINGYIRRIAAWNSRISNANLQTLTT